MCKLMKPSLLIIKFQKQIKTLQSLSKFNYLKIDLLTTEICSCKFHHYFQFYTSIKQLFNKTQRFAMDINDFTHNFKYKLIIPTLYLISWVLMFTGPTFYQPEYQAICIVLMLYLCVRLFHVSLNSIYIYFRFRQIVSRTHKLKQATPQIKQDISKQLLYIFIIPNYKEEIELLHETLQTLAKHSQAIRKYAVYLAMEAHEEGCENKAKKLIQMFQDKFLHIDYTIHSMRQYQQKGKASNVSWCVQHLQQIFFNPKGIDKSLVMITIIDADSLAPEIYIQQIEQHLKSENNFNNRHNFIYSPNQIFYRNHHESPVFNRICDDFHAAMHSAYMPTFTGVTFPLSNYTASYVLFQKIGFWDTCSDAIGQDCHTTMKAMWKTKGNAISVPIYIPFNQVNIATGNGYFKDIEAKFWQTQRHGRAITDVSYALSMFFKNPLNWRSFISTLMIVQMYFVPATIPWATISLAYQSLIIFQFYKPSPQLVAFFPYIYLILNFTSSATILLYFFYYLLKRKAGEVLFNKKSESFLRFFEFPLIYPLIAFLIDLPSFVVAAFGSLFEQREYNVAQKIMNKKKIEEDI